MYLSVCFNVCQPRAVAIASALTGGCGLSHKHVKDGCKGTGLGAEHMR